MTPINKEHLHNEIDLGILAYQVSSLISQHPDTMLQFSADQIVQYVEQGLGVFITHPDNPNELAAYAKLFKLPGVNQHEQVVYEFGSWVVPKKYQGLGFGEAVLYQMVAQGKKIDPSAQIVGVTEVHNLKPQKIMLEAGGVMLNQDQWPTNFKITLQDGQAEVVMVDLSEI